MVVVLILDRMRPGLTIFSCAVCFMLLGVITPEQLAAGFSNREMLTVGLLFLIGEGVRESGALNYLTSLILPKSKGRTSTALLRFLPAVTALSAVINNTAVVVIFAPVIKRWARKMGMPAKRLLIPLSYATILGGMSTLVGTSTNMVVNGMMTEAGYRGMRLFEIGSVGIVIAVVGLIYVICFSSLLLPGDIDDNIGSDDSIVEVMLTSRFPGLGRTLETFDFKGHYRVSVMSISRNGVTHTGEEMQSHRMVVGDTLRLKADEKFIRTWRESSSFYILDGTSIGAAFKKAPNGKFKWWWGVAMLLLFIGGVSVDSYITAYGGDGWGVFPVAAGVVVLMAITGLFPPKRYTKFITWDILIAIASAFAISQAMVNSGVNTMIAELILTLSKGWGAVGAMALLYLVTMLFTEVISNNAAVAIAFPVAVALSQQLGVDAMPLFIAITIAASASFSSPIGYQTNLIVLGVGGYSFKDFLKMGLGLNILVFIISIALIPIIWPL